MLLRFAMRVVACSFLLLFLLGGTLEIRWKDPKNTETAQGMTLHANLRLQIPHLQAFGGASLEKSEEAPTPKKFSVLETLKQSFLVAYGEPLPVIPTYLNKQMDVHPQASSPSLPLQLTPHSVAARISHLVSLGPEPEAP